MTKCEVGNRLTPWLILRPNQTIYQREQHIHIKCLFAITETFKEFCTFEEATHSNFQHYITTLGAETFASRNFREFCPISGKFKTRKIPDSRKFMHAKFFKFFFFSQNLLVALDNALILVAWH